MPNMLITDHAAAFHGMLAVPIDWRLFWRFVNEAPLMIVALAIFVLVAFVLQYVSIALAAWRCRARGARVVQMLTPAKASTPADLLAQQPVTIVRPVCGLEPYSRETLGSSFDLDWPQFELIFCAADAGDPVLDIVRTLMAEHPHVRASIITGGAERYANPKLSNMALGWRAARTEWSDGFIIFTDSNVLLPRDYLHQMFAPWSVQGLQRTGMVSAPPAGQAPQGPWAHVECAMLNAWQARVQYAVDTLGFGFAQGKNLMFKRADLEQGGFEAMAREPAEDAAATKLIRSKGGRVRLASPPFAQLLGPRSLQQVWSRHLRWARLRRTTFPLLYAPEIFSGPACALIAALVLAHYFDVSLSLCAAVFLTLWYLPEFVLTHLARWPQTIWQPLTFMVRDVMIMAIFAASWFGREIVWNGHVVASASEPVQGEDAGKDYAGAR